MLLQQYTFIYLFEGGGHFCPPRPSPLWRVHHNATACHNNDLRDCLSDFWPGLACKFEKGYNFGYKDCKRPADFLVPNWSLSHSLAFKFNVEY